MQRNISLDYFKLLLSILIVGLHALFMSELPIIGYGIQQGITRLAVPCFFIINGYFLHSKINAPSKIQQYIKRLLIPYLVWMIIYLPFHHHGRVPNEIMPEYAANLFAWVFGWGHLWYISTLIMSTAILYFLKKWNVKDKTLLYIFISFYFLGYLMQRLYFFDIDFQFYAITRTFLFMGLPFIYIGYYIRANKIEDTFKLSYQTYIIATILIVSIFVESYLPLHFNRATDFYLALPILCPILFLIVLKKEKCVVTDGFMGKLPNAIYYSHMMILLIISQNTVYASTKLFLIALFFTLVVSTGIIYLNKHLKIFL